MWDPWFSLCLICLRVGAEEASHLERAMEEVKKKGGGDSQKPVMSSLGNRKCEVYYERKF